MAALAIGSGAAIAATGGDREQAEQAVLEDAAQRLDVTPEELRSALSSAQDAELDRAVQEGRLTQEQADAIRARRAENGRVLGVAPGHRHGPGHRGGMMRGATLDAVAEALDMSREDLLDELRSGRSIAEIAEARDEDLDDVRQAARDAYEERLDEGVDAGRITAEQREEMLERLDERVDRLMEKTGTRFHGPRGGERGGARPESDDQDAFFAS